MGIQRNEKFVRDKPKYRSINISKSHPFETFNRGIVFRTSEEEVKRIYNKKYCLSIGINLYENWTRLTNAVFDATELARILNENFSFETKVLIDKEATKKNIGEVFIEEVSETLKEDDLLVVFFAGHGHSENLANQQQKGYLVPVDARNGKKSDLISMETFKEWTGYVKCRHILYIFDACFSGLASFRSNVSRRDADFLKRKARLVISAGGANQVVTDRGWNNHSVFTGLLINELINEQNFDKAGLITATDLFTKLSAAVPEFSHQTPAFGIFPDHEGGDIIFETASGVFHPAPINLIPPSLISETMAGMVDGIGPSYVKCLPDLKKDIEYRYVRNDVTIFAEEGKQWAFIIGAHPSKILRKPEILTETLDAIDISDWFVNPEIYGAIPAERLFFLVNESANETMFFNYLKKIEHSIGVADSLLFYFSGHVTRRGKVPILALSDADLDKGTGVVKIVDLLKTFNSLKAKKVVGIFDPGGSELHESIRDLKKGRYYLASGAGYTNLRNSLMTWYLKRIVQKFGKETRLNQIVDVLEEADKTLTEMGASKMHPYLIGKD